jgi:hypothetical protein
VQLFFELDRRLRKQQENIMTSFKVVALALLSATAVREQSVAAIVRTAHGLSQISEFE